MAETFSFYCCGCKKMCYGKAHPIPIGDLTEEEEIDICEIDVPAHYYDDIRIEWYCLDCYMKN